MRVVVLCAEPEAEERSPASLPAILRDLGCSVRCGRFDGSGLDRQDLTDRPADIVIVDAGDDVPRGHRCLRWKGGYPPLAAVPTLITVTLPRLPALDFSAGATDFVLAPLVPAELYARLRQLDWRNAAFGSDEVVKVDDLLIDASGYEARIGGRRVELTHQEFELLHFFAVNRGRAFGREQLLRRVWGCRYAGGTRTVDIHVRRLRSKLGPVIGDLIETVRRVGYKMRGEERLPPSLVERLPPAVVDDAPCLDRPSPALPGPTPLASPGMIPDLAPAPSRPVSEEEDACSTSPNSPPARDTFAR